MVGDVSAMVLPDLAAVAEPLGITEAELQAALSDPAKGQLDLAAAAEELIVTEADLTVALEAAV